MFHVPQRWVHVNGCWRCLRFARFERCSLEVDSDLPPTQSPQTSAHKYILPVQIVSSALEATSQDFCLHLLRLRGGRGGLGWGEWKTPPWGQQEAVLSKIDTNNFTKLLNYASKKSLCWMSATNTGSHPLHMKSRHDFIYNKQLIPLAVYEVTSCT